jgi:hypothetical protein
MDVHVTGISRLGDASAARRSKSKIISFLPKQNCNINKHPPSDGPGQFLLAD